MRTVKATRLEVIDYLKMTSCEQHFREHQRIVEQSLARLVEKIDEVGNAVVQALGGSHKVIAFGNGGSAAQASHLAGELLGRFSRERRPLAAISLASDPAAVTCIANDFGYGDLFARQIRVLAQRGDIAIGFTTSGTSENVLRGLGAAQERGAVTIALTGANGLKSGGADFLLDVPSNNTAHVQEVHLMIVHALCLAIDQRFAGK